jgi:hypothetical protein
MSSLAAAPHAPTVMKRERASAAQQVERGSLPPPSRCCYVSCFPCMLTLRFVVKEKSQAHTQSGCFTLRGKHKGASSGPSRVVETDGSRAGAARRGAEAQAGSLEGLGAVALEDPDVIVGACCRQQLAIWAPGHVAAPVCVPLETELGLLDHCRRHCPNRAKLPVFPS